MFLYIRFLFITSLIILFTNSFGQDHATAEQPSAAPKPFTIPTNSSSTSTQYERKAKSDDVKPDLGSFQWYKELPQGTNYYFISQENGKTKICEVYIKWSRDKKRVVNMKDMGIHLVPTDEVHGNPSTILGDHIIFANQKIYTLTGETTTETPVGPTNTQFYSISILSGSALALIYLLGKLGKVW